MRSRSVSCTQLIATQSEYSDLQSQIEALVLGVPAVRETSQYRNIIQSLEEKQNSLLAQITAWETQFSPSMSLLQAVQLSQSIHSQLNRFNDESRQRLNTLVERLDNIILQRETEEKAAETSQNIENQQDSQTMDSIRQYTLQKANTIYLCEEAIRAVTSLQNNLNSPKPLMEEINTRVQQFSNKILEDKNNLQKLRDRLSQVETAQQINHLREEYAKLDFVFKESTEYATYQKLQTEINLVAEDIEQLRSWENLYEQSESVGACDRALETLAKEQLKLHNRERFRQKTQQLQQHLLRRKQSYIEKERDSVKRWLDNLQIQFKRLEKCADASEKLTAANNLHKRILQEKYQYERILELEQRQTLERIVNLCVEIEGRDTESKIITLFEGLPRRKQEGLLKKLEGYLK
ncbi:hypothetical protein [Scytonema sp. NUACC26]|uniref:hypothetical protein n=1 Tax=Scytonema sp. NUACC26 TaxID=3140176 RepID=UPI0034DC43D9